MALYQALSKGEWQEKEDYFGDGYSPCNLCPRRCGADRKNDQEGICGATREVKIASFNLHFGEEPPISGIHGSGTVFFSGCPLKCIFCQNYPISHLGNGTFYSIDELADIFIGLQRKGAHNINLVSPTPYYYHFVKALFRACRKGLMIPIVNNTGSYERLETIRMLKGVIDVYLPDLKYTSRRMSHRFSGVDGYHEFAFPAVQEMVNQVGELVTNRDGIAQKGVIIRHLILPGYTDNSKRVLETIAASPLRDVSLSVMGQYFPAFKAVGDCIDRRITHDEYAEIKEYALSLGLENGWFQEL